MDDRKSALAARCMDQQGEITAEADAQAWFDSARWNLTGTQADSDFKAGMWWSDAKDMRAVAAPMRIAADDWDAQRTTLAAARTQVAAARLRARGGAASMRLDVLQTIEESILCWASAVAPIPLALRSCAGVVERGHHRMHELWHRWKCDSANPAKCDLDTQAMQPIVSAMAQALLDAAGALIRGYRAGLEMPGIPASRAAHAQTQRALLVAPRDIRPDNPAAGIVVASAPTPARDGDLAMAMVIAGLLGRAASAYPGEPADHVGLFTRTCGRP